MGPHVKIAAGLLVTGLLVIAGYKAFLSLAADSSQVLSSDAKDIKGKLTIGVDNWIGYFPLCSPQMHMRMRRSGYNLVCVDDHADYPGRMRKLAGGELQFAVATVDSYLLNGAKQGYPGTIVTVIDESKGGDAIVAWKDQVPNIEALKANATSRILYTPASPSEHLLKSSAVHFDIPLRGRKGWGLAADGSADALKRFLKKEAAVAVLWEPDVSRALKKPGVVKLLGTEDTKRLIVDVLTANREFALRDPEAVTVLLTNYFLTLKHYRGNQEELLADAADAAGMDEEDVKAMLHGVNWMNLSANVSEWFGVAGAGVAEDGVAESIADTVKILLDAGDFTRNPIPNDDAYRLINSQFVASIYATGGASAEAEAAAANAGNRFPPLSSAEWARLREIGTLKVLPILFQSGTAELTMDGKSELDEAVGNLKYYPNFRVVVKGHTGVQGDPAANKQLSQERAESVARYLEVTYGIESSRLHPRGLGAERPLPRRPGESNRAYNYRLPRVELFLVTEEM